MQIPQSTVHSESQIDGRSLFRKILLGTYSDQMSEEVEEDQDLAMIEPQMPNMLWRRVILRHYKGMRENLRMKNIVKAVRYWRSVMCISSSSPYSYVIRMISGLARC